MFHTLPNNIDVMEILKNLFSSSFSKRNFPMYFYIFWRDKKTTQLKSGIFILKATTEHTLFIFLILVCFNYTYIFIYIRTTMSFRYNSFRCMQLLRGVQRVKAIRAKIYLFVFTAIVVEKNKGWGNNDAWLLIDVVIVLYAMIQYASCYHRQHLSLFAFDSVISHGYQTESSGS